MNKSIYFIVFYKKVGGKPVLVGKAYTTSYNGGIKIKDVWESVSGNICILSEGVESMPAINQSPERIEEILLGV